MLLLLRAALLASCLLLGSVTAQCGNGIVEPGEKCDDANVVETDGCLSNCTLFSPTCDLVTLQFADLFNALSYSNSDGNADWSGSPWVEAPGVNGPALGVVQVTPGTSSLAFIEGIVPNVAGASATRIVPFSSAFGFTPAEYGTVSVSYTERAVVSISYFVTLCDATCTAIYYRQCRFVAPATCPAPVGVELPPVATGGGVTPVVVGALPPAALLADLTVRFEVAPEVPLGSHVVGTTLLEIDAVDILYAGSVGPLCCATNVDCGLLMCTVGKCVNGTCQFIPLTTGGSYLDLFGGGSYAGSDGGTLDWSPFPWLETGDDATALPTAGQARVSGGEWIVFPNHTATITITRKVPTSNTTVDGAMLLIQGTVNSAGDGQFELALSQDGVSFTTLVCQHSLVFGPMCAGSTAATIIADININLAINITAFIGPHMTIAMRSLGPCTLFFPCVQITAVEVVLNVTQCDDGDPCTMGDACVSGACLPTMSLFCDDANACTLGDTCVNGSCVFQAPIAAPCDVCGVHLEETTASPIVVTTTLDVIDPLDGVISMREAVAIANSRAGDQEIVAAAGTYAITLLGDDDQNCVGDFDLQ